MKLKGNCLVGQSGGPTSVINASILGAIKTALASDVIDTVYGAKNGIKGVLDDKLINLNKESIEELDRLMYTPSAALGSCRYKLKDPTVDDTDYLRILEIFKKYNIRYFFYNGGNDSMDTCNKVSKFMLAHNYDCRVIGIPKTIDNDLFGTDHCPGYGSAAKYIATTIMEIKLDATVYDKGAITVVEIMGRNAGWLAAASVLAKTKNLGPDLVFLPEKPVVLNDMLNEIADFYKKNGSCVVAVSEGIKDPEGVYISQYASMNVDKVDSFGHIQMGGLASYLAYACGQKTGAKVRGIELSLLQRCAAHSASKTDYLEAFEAGKMAVLAAIDGQTDKMVGFKCDRSNGYKCETFLLDLEHVANYEKKVPLEWILEDNSDLTKDFYDYALPLIQGNTELEYDNGLPLFANLKKIID